MNKYGLINSQSKGKKLLSCAIAVLVAIALCASVFCTGCAGKYELTEKSPTISNPDIIESGVLKVGVDADNAPFAANNSKKTAGIDVDLGAAIADELGLKVEIVDVGSNPSDALSKKECDIVLGIEKSSSVLNAWKSEEYLQTAAALFATKSSAVVPKKSDSFKFATQMGSLSALAVQNQFNSQNIKVQTDMKECFKLLQDNTVNYVAADVICGYYVAYANQYDASLIALLQNPSGYVCAVSQSNTKLQKAITDALSNIKNNGTMDIISKKWIGRTIDLSSVPLTEGAANQASSSDLENAVYEKVTGSSITN